MKKSLFALMAVAVSATVTIPAYAQDSYDQNSTETWRNCYRGTRTPAQARNYENVTIFAKNGKAPSLQQVEQAIASAGRLKKWTMKTVSQGTAAGKMEASLLVRNKHTVVVDITYSPEKYSIMYKDSTNMNAAFCNGKTWLHRNYNVWVSRLHDEIQAKLDTM